MAKKVVGLVAVAAAVFLGATTAAARGVAAPSVFARAGAFVDNPQDFPGPDALAAELEADHFTWVALHVDDLLTFSLVEQQWFDAMRAHGILVGAWGVAGNDPVASAVVADLAIREFGFDFYIEDAEAPYEKPHGYWRSWMFVRAFRSFQPTIPAALVTLGAAKGSFVLPINFAAWRNAGFELLPEAYYNQFPGYRPDLTVRHAIRAGWPVSLVHPVIGVYHHYPAARYVPLLENDGAVGFSVVLADQATPADFQALAGLAAATQPAG